MRSASVAEAKAKLLEQVEAGEVVTITRRGKPVARLVAEESAEKKAIDVERLRRFAATVPFQTESAGDFMSRVREEGLI